MLDDFDPDELTRLRTEVERLRNELFVAQAHLTEAKSDCAKPEQQKIVSAFGHDARSSLALVLGWAELLVHDRLTPEKRQLAYDTIYDAGWRIEASLRWFEKSLESRAK